VRCPEENVDADISKQELMILVARHASGKNMRNLAEGMAGAIVRLGVYWATKGFLLPGDLAKKIGNRLAYKKQAPLTAFEAVGCASYAQWLPDLDKLVCSDRIKSLLAEDLEIRKQGRNQGARQGQQGRGQSGRSGNNQRGNNQSGNSQTRRRRSRRRRG
jgi:hypothetical protein